VGLHRAAFLLYNHPPLARAGVLVIGPSRTFLRYIAQVLPSLGEEAVIQATIADIAPCVRVKGEDRLDVGRVKGDARLAPVLSRALRLRRRPIEDDVVLRARFATCALTAQEVNGLADSIAEGGAPYKAGRAALRSRLLGLARRRLRESGHMEVTEPWLEGELSSSDAFRSLMDRLWPSVSPAALVRDLLSSADRLERANAGLLADADLDLVVRVDRRGPAPWTTDDLPLLDEAEFLVNGRKQAYGHIVVDEAQDLSPMQFRMVARRAPSGSLTILGDLAQATGAWNYHHWDEILAHLPTSAPVRREELTLGYRAPGQVLDLASKLLAVSAPMVAPTRSIRPGRHEPRIIRVEPDHLVARGLDEAVRLAGEECLVGLVAAPDHLAALANLVRGRTDVGILERDGITRPVTLVGASATKGLEFDAAVVVEPSAIAGTELRGLRMLYVAMTRPIRHLSIVHSEPLPDPLTG
jgi:DNA helicase IV